MSQPRPDSETLSLSVVIPCFNEEDCLSELVDRVLGACSWHLLDGNYEIVLVNDGSQDATWELIKEASEQHSTIVGVNLSRNHGHQLALTAGLSVCRGNRIFILDADLQDPPELLPDMMSKMDEGFDVVYGQRRKRKGETFFKTLTAKIFYRFLANMTDVTIPVDTGDFRLMSRRALDVLLSMPEKHRFIRGMVSWIGFPQAPLQYERDERFAGQTKYPLKKMIAFAIDAITSFSTRPLRFASQLGFLFGLLGCALIIYIIIGYWSGNAIQGWTSLAAIVVILGSTQMVLLGVIGEYLGRLYMETKGRPMFIIQEIVSTPSQHTSSHQERANNHFSKPGEAPTVGSAAD